MVASYSTGSCGIGAFDLCGTWTLRVEGDKVAIVGYARHDVPSDTLATGDYLKFLTIDSLFEEAGKTINEGPFDYMGLPVDYMINFDDGKGYPREMRQDGRQRNDGGMNSMAWHLRRYITVHDLIVIRTLDN
jgi:hypothetical protein